ncbi:hypothetical protein C2W62_50925 [Candidatus Entotheonella serta]|nr:hypothetical protein C2W62_50925 [Candidatus Entotheonella serta]
MVWLGLYLAKTLLNAQIPPHIDAQISADRHVRILGERFKRNLFTQTYKKTGWLEMARLHIHMRKQMKYKLKYTYRLLSTKLIDSLFMPMGRPQ